MVQNIAKVNSYIHLVSLINIPTEYIYYIQAHLIFNKIILLNINYSTLLLYIDNLHVLYTVIKLIIINIYIYIYV